MAWFDYWDAPGTLLQGSGIKGTPYSITSSRTARPDPGYVFRKWHGDLWESHAATSTIDLLQPRHVVAEFIERPGLAALDLVADLQALLTAMGVSESVDTFDRNSVGYDMDVNHVYGPNGIPDAAEFKLLETVLKRTWLDLSVRSGIVHDLAWEAWSGNLALVKASATGLPYASAAVQRAVAAYMTLGDYDSAAFAEYAAVTVAPDTLLTMEPYSPLLMPFLPFDRDADNDAVLNVEEWEDNAPNRTQFADAALDPGQGVLPVPDASKDLVVCSNASCDEVAYLTHVQPHEGCETYVTVVSSGGVQEIGYGVPTAVPLGAQVWLRAKSAAEHEFSVWLASGTRADMSPSLYERFTFVEDTSVVGLFGDYLSIEIPASSSTVEISATARGDAYLTVEDGRLLAKGPWGTSFVTVSANYINDPGQLVTRVNRWEYPSGDLTGMYSYDPSVTLPVAGGRPGLSSTTAVSEPRVTHTCTAGQGGSVLMAVVESQNGFYWNGTMAGSIAALASGAMVSWTATANDGWRFVGWDDGPVATPTITEPVGEVPKHKTAHFEQGDLFKLVTSATTVDSEAAPLCVGYVVEDPASRGYATGAEVKLTAVPKAGYVFVHWKGSGNTVAGATVEDNPLPRITIAMTQNRSATAVFKYAPIVVYQDFRQIYERDFPWTDYRDDMATISAVPEMPNLEAYWACADSSAPVLWTLHVTQDATCGRDDPSVSLDSDVYFGPTAAQSETYALVPANEPFVPDWGGSFYGGVAEIKARFGDQEQSFTFRIGGLNPDDGAARTYIDQNAGVHWYAYAIAKRESRLTVLPDTCSFYNQFEPPEDDAVPLRGFPCGYGIMQCDPPTRDEPASPGGAIVNGNAWNEMWNWHVNVDLGIDRLDAKRDEAVSFWNEQMQQQRDEIEQYNFQPKPDLSQLLFNWCDVHFQEPDKSFAVYGSIADMLTIQAFNGTAPLDPTDPTHERHLPDHRLVSWKNTVRHEDGTFTPGLWQYYPDHRDYVCRVCAQIDKGSQPEECDVCLDNWECPQCLLPEE